jgi:four helix bundle protein
MIYGVAAGIRCGALRLIQPLCVMQSPQNLDLTPRARALALQVYRATADFPSSERFGLAAQMRRAAVSVGSNICEGCGRKGDKELVQFLHMALGSVSELEFQAAVALDLELLTLESAPTLIEEINHVKRMLLRLITAVRARAAGKSRR